MGRAKITEIPPLPTPAKNFVFVLYLNVEQELFSKNMRDRTFIPIHGAPRQPEKHPRRQSYIGAPMYDHYQRLYASKI